MLTQRDVEAVDLIDFHLTVKQKFFFLKLSTQRKLFQFGIQKLKERIDTEGQQIVIVDDSRSGEVIRMQNLPVKKW